MARGQRASTGSELGQGCEAARDSCSSASSGPTQLDDPGTPSQPSHTQRLTILPPASLATFVIKRFQLEQAQKLLLLCGKRECLRKGGDLKACRKTGQCSASHRITLPAHEISWKVFWMTIYVRNFVLKWSKSKTWLEHRD